MNKTQAIQRLRIWDKQGKYVFTRRELKKLFFENSEKTFSEGLRRLVKSGLLQHVCRGIYLNPHANSFDGYAIEHIAKALRPGEYNYISLESMLSEYGLISQIPVDRLTVMTTGRTGIYYTDFGVIEFTHTKRAVPDLLEGIQSVKERPLRIAMKEIAWRDLKRVGRNVSMVDFEEINRGER